jgi:hypothetical protein
VELFLLGKIAGVAIQEIVTQNTPVVVQKLTAEQLAQ